MSFITRKRNNMRVQVNKYELCIEEIPVNVKSIKIQDQAIKASRENSVERDTATFRNNVVYTNSTYSEDQDFETERESSQVRGIL